MDHPLPVSDALVRPWRTAAYVAATIAVLELFVLLVIGGNALVGAASDRLQLAAQERTLSSPAPTATRTARRPPPTPAAKLPRSRTTVMVLNGNGRTGAAAAAATRVHARGYRIGTVGNAPREVTRSLVMYKPGFSGEGLRLARDLRIGRAGPLDGIRPRDLGRAQLVYILGS